MKLQTQKKEEIKRTRITKGALQLVRRSPSPALVSCQRYDAKCRNNYSIVFFSAAGRKGKKKKKRRFFLEPWRVSCWQRPGRLTKATEGIMAAGL